MSGTSDQEMDFYFDFADTIDINYLIDKFKDGRPEPDVFRDLINLVTQIMTSFGIAGHEFLTGIGQKMNFSKYID